ncbi:MAG: hypothetical protein A2021_04230 [Elusimicrobia bacterium GWF2_52_66]|nr:MAG: hypothetical protein A2X33_04055 [Elusimicrobia bacterium GWA2_51_34]OGR85927.1 MAG: hypothetical protein A2021_04230 [Elusimicrobia bacterium GWF2_52_66]HAF96518.1 hypothetical protein [Elusimicrobiota bacterium]HCE97597.1 hypothetical protein [Elusimicrobiota bacterium]
MGPENEKVEIRVVREDAAWKKQFDSFYCDYPPPKSTLTMPHAYFAAYRDGEIVAHSVIYKKRAQWTLDGLRVKPEWRQQGIGKALTAERIRYAIKNGAKEIWYACEDGNLVTTCCHLRFGFQKVCRKGRSCPPAQVHRYRLKVTADLLQKLNT